MKFLLFFFCLILGIQCEGAPVDQTAEAVHRLIEAANKPFDDFALAALSVAPPALPDPKSSGVDPRVEQVRDQLWRQINSVEWIIDPAASRKQLRTFSLLTQLRSWFLQRPTYTNLLMASYIEENVSMAILTGLKESVVSLDEAESIDKQLRPMPSTQAILKVVEGHFEGSAAASTFKEALRANEAMSLSSFADRWAEERREEYDLRPEFVLSDVFPARLIGYVATAEFTRYVVSNLIDYVGKGGDLHLRGRELRADLMLKIPDAVETTEPVTRVKVSKAMFSGAVEGTVQWKKIIKR